MARIDVNGISLNVEVAGDGPSRAHSHGDAERVPSILLLHGFTGSTATWQAHLPALSAHRKVVAVDLIGHGASAAPADTTRYSMAQCCYDLLAMLDRLEIEQCAVLGYSMGARVALHLAVSAPRRVSALVLESGSPGIADPAERAARREADEALANRIECDGIEAFVDYWEALPLFASQRALLPDVRLELRRQRLCNNPKGLANSLRGMGTGAQEPLWDRLGHMSVPILLMVGALDAKFREIGGAMASAIPGARLAVVPGAGHAVHLEQPAEFERLIVDELSPAAYRHGATGGRR